MNSGAWEPGAAETVAGLITRTDALLAEMRARHAGTWYNLPSPRRWHRCRVAHEAAMDDGVLVERCACGGIRINGGRWMERNR